MKSSFRDFLLYFLALSIGTIAAIFLFYKILFSYWSRRGVFTLAPSIPFGNARNLLTLRQFWGDTFSDIYFELKKRHLPYGGFYFLGVPSLVVADLDVTKSILMNDFVHFTDRIFTNDRKSNALTSHLFSEKGARWKELRTKLSPVFTSGKLKMMFDCIRECALDMRRLVANNLEHTRTLDIQDLTSRYTTDVIGSCIFGLESNAISNPNCEFRKYTNIAFDHSFYVSIKRVLMFMWPKLLDTLHVKAVDQCVADFFEKIVKDVVDYRERTGTTRADFMQLLIDLKNAKDGAQALTLKEMTSQAFLFFIAGFETSANTMWLTLYELASQGQLQDEVRDEINGKLSEEANLTYDVIAQMPLLDRCVSETLRKYPLVPAHLRMCTKEYRMPKGDLTVEKGTYVYLPVLGIQRDPDIYPDPDRYDPDRFLPECVAKRHVAAYTPFGEGPRLCIGQRFGLIQTKIGLIELLSKYKFTMNPKTKWPFKMEPATFIINSHDPILLDVEEV